MAEEPLGANGACLLGSINLSKYVKKPYHTDAKVDYDSLQIDVYDVVKALNNVLQEGISKHALPQQAEFAQFWRAIGLGTMGLAEMFIKLNLKYDSEEAIITTKIIMRNIAATAVMASLDMAKSRGCYPGCCTKEDKELLANSNFIQALNLPESVINDIKEYGLYNSQLLTCAPTGSISNLFRTSGGIEPYFAFSYNRMTKSLVGEDKSFEVREKVVDDYMNSSLSWYDWKDNPIFVCSQNIDPMMRIKMQAAAQMYIDASISSTINLPETATIEDVGRLYFEAYKEGCKGLTIFRAGCKRGAILTTEKPKEKKEEIKEKKVIFDSIEPIHRSTLGTTYGQTQQKKCACGKLYVTCNKDEQGNIVELFTHTSKGGICQANLNAVTRMVSLSLRSGVKVAEIVDQLKGIHCPACQALRAKGQNVDGLSCPDIMSKVLFDTFTLKKKEVWNSVEQNLTQIVTLQEDDGLVECPECHQKTLRHEAGCVSCTSCGYSKCN